MKSNNQFSHGGDILAFSKKIGSKPKEIIDLSSNINFLKPKIKTDLNNLDISNYPTYEKLYKIIAKKYSVKADEIELFNGGSSAIFSFFRYIDLKHCTIYSPAYLEYKKAAQTFGFKIDLINRFEQVNKKVKKNSLVIFVNPSTPDGKYYDLDKLFNSWLEKNCTIFVDESFLDFTNKKSIISKLKSYDKLYILKSMTKIYSSASIRVGTLISNAKNIKKIKDKEPLWKLSHFDSIYLQNAIKNRDFISETIKITKENKKYTIKHLQKFDFIKKIYKSQANYLLLELQDCNAQTLQDKLISYKIMIRDCSNFDFLNNSFVRVAIKDKKSMQKFIKALKNEFKCIL
ncbi:aminotransferase class I and II [Arcobacter nitrofigilis DSM 7299]|uniref:Aminotransferase class I and II n=1 Tax=Arcobacter nitrofigilis (strain ATCC 33309 / DSM 7299 / CCUG 15893 / LMG 7604 / NCTC 12251 / CI) TaxID=572480 RepID=D5V1R3_ARCNC|nr:aminotransferase class I/II-fold pyridoxal phosphate-dependent enzyme [Arcobacter nitrofigilis]ADG93497.1 aminotransferase class I and II [Arcobacter nitrofigilis DSM 7299]